MRSLPLKIKLSDDGSGDPYVECRPEEATHLKMLFPLSELSTVYIPVKIGVKVAGSWMWNGSTDRPTVEPSILRSCGDFRCHVFVRDGRVQFLDDCTHEQAGRTLDLLEIPPTEPVATV